MDRQTLLTAFRLQAGLCRHLGSPFYGALMDAAMEDVRSDGPVAAFLESWKGDPLHGFLPLRLFGAVHQRVLAGGAPDLARFYPTAGGRADPDAAWPAFRAVVSEQADRLRPTLERFPQTNEVRRCSGLLGGFLEIGARTGLPLRLREIGCSAGLNLQWSRYAYALGPHRWGDPTSPVKIAADWQGPAPRLVERPGIESRAGCDLDPPSISDDAAARVLESYVWADQPERLEQLRSAIAVARSDPPRVERARAEDWLARELPAPDRGVCRVVYHSSVWSYLSAAEQARVRALLDGAGRAATREAPVAWLRAEADPSNGRVEVRLALWPDGDDRLLGYGHPHGRRVEWLG